MATSAFLKWLRRFLLVLIIIIGLFLGYSYFFVIGATLASALAATATAFVSYWVAFVSMATLVTATVFPKETSDLVRSIGKDIRKGGKDFLKYAFVALCGLAIYKKVTRSEEYTELDSAESTGGDLDYA